MNIPSPNRTLIVGDPERSNNCSDPNRPSLAGSFLAKDLASTGDLYAPYSTQYSQFNYNQDQLLHSSNRRFTPIILLLITSTVILILFGLLITLAKYLDWPLGPLSSFLGSNNSNNNNGHANNNNNNRHDDDDHTRATDSN